MRATCCARSVPSRSTPKGWLLRRWPSWQHRAPVQTTCTNLSAACCRHPTDFSQFQVSALLAGFSACEQCACTGPLPAPIETPEFRCAKFCCSATLSVPTGTPNLLFTLDGEPQPHKITGLWIPSWNLQAVV